MEISARREMHGTTVSKVLSSRLGGAIFVGTSAGSAIRVVAAGTVLGGLVPAPRDRWLVVGAWQESEEYGRQLHAERAYLVHPSGRLLAAFLERRVPGTGRLAARLHARLGSRLEGMLERADLASLAAALALPGPGRSLAMAARFVQACRSASAEADLACHLDGHGLDGPRLAAHAVDTLGPAARDRIRANPYVLASMADSWPKLDTIAWGTLQGPGQSPRRDRRRLVGAVDHAVKAAVARGGGTVVEDGDVRAGVALCLGLKPRSATVTEAIRLAEEDGGLVALPGGAWRTPAGVALEDGLARKFDGMAGHAPGAVAVPDDATLESMLAAGPHAVRALGPDHRVAAFRCLRESPSVLAGSWHVPVFQAVHFLWGALGGRFVASSPGWPAAELLSRSAGMPVRVLAELLADLETDAFDCLPGGGAAALDASTLLAVEDANAVPLGMWDRLVARLPTGCRLLLAGDHDQLPPLGPGLVFHPMAEARGAAARVHCQPRAPPAGSLAAARSSTATGLVPATAAFRGRADGAFVEPCGPGDLHGTVSGIVSALGGFGSRFAVQVVTPSDKGSGRADELNAMFHAAHLEAAGIAQPAGPGDFGPEVVRGYRRQWFAVGEPVVLLREDSRRGIAAGTIGRVGSVMPGARHLVAMFGEREAGFGPGDLAELAPAWCLHGNLIQACRPERMVVALSGGRDGLDRSWIHAAVARATRQVVFVGDTRAIGAAMRRPPAWKARRVAFRVPGGHRHGTGTPDPADIVPKNPSRIALTGCPVPAALNRGR